MLLTLLDTCALRILWVLLVVPSDPTIERIIFAYPLTWIVTSAAFIVYYFYHMNRALRPVANT